MKMAKKKKTLFLQNQPLNLLSRIKILILDIKMLLCCGCSSRLGLKYTEYFTHVDGILLLQTLLLNVYHIIYILISIIL